MKTREGKSEHNRKERLSLVWILSAWPFVCFSFPLSPPKLSLNLPTHLKSLNLKSLMPFMQLGTLTLLTTTLLSAQLQELSLFLRFTFMQDGKMVHLLFSSVDWVLIEELTNEHQPQVWYFENPQGESGFPYGCTMPPVSDPQNWNWTTWSFAPMLGFAMHNTAYRVTVQWRYGVYMKGPKRTFPNFHHHQCPKLSCDISWWDESFKMGSSSWDCWHDFQL